MRKFFGVFLGVCVISFGVCANLPYVLSAEAPPDKPYTVHVDAVGALKGSYHFTRAYDTEDACIAAASSLDIAHALTALLEMLLPYDPSVRLDNLRCERADKGV